MIANNTKRPDALFIGDNKALDFLNTIAQPSKIKYDWLSNGQDLFNWLIQIKHVSIEDIEHFKQNHYLQEIDNIASEVRTLREWFRRFIIKHTNETTHLFTNTDIKYVNDILEQDHSYTQIENIRDSQGRYYSKRLKRRFQAPQDLLLPIAESIADLICNKDFNQIKKCQNSKCTIWFLDSTKNHSRNWCSMSICGNRAKAAQYRLKKKLAKIQI